MIRCRHVGAASIIFYISERQGNLRGNQVSFHPRVNAMQQLSATISAVMYGGELLYIFGFGAITRRDLHTLSVQCDSPRDNHYVRVV